MCGQFHTGDPNHMIKAINNVTILSLQICLNSSLVCLAGRSKCFVFSSMRQAQARKRERERQIKESKDEKQNTSSPSVHYTPLNDGKGLLT